MCRGIQVIWACTDNGLPAYDGSREGAGLAGPNWYDWFIQSLAASARQDCSPNLSFAQANLLDSGKHISCCQEWRPQKKPANLTVRAKSNSLRFGGDRKTIPLLQVNIRFILRMTGISVGYNIDDAGLSLSENYRVRSGSYTEMTVNEGVGRCWYAPLPVRKFRIALLQRLAYRRY